METTTTISTADQVRRIVRHYPQVRFHDGGKWTRKLRNPITGETHTLHRLNQYTVGEIRAAAAELTISDEQLANSLMKTTAAFAAEQVKLATSIAAGEIIDANEYNRLARILAVHAELLNSREEA